MVVRVGYRNPRRLDFWMRRVTVTWLVDYGGLKEREMM